MHDFVLSLVRNGGEVLVQAESEISGQAPPVVLAAKDVLALGAATRRIDATIDGPLASPAACRRTAEQIGRGLYRKVFRTGVRKLFERALDAAHARKAGGLRLLVQAGHDPELHELPWELLHDGRRFLSHSPTTPVVRSLEETSPVQGIAIEPPLRVLLTTASPRADGNGERIDGHREERVVRAALDSLGGRATLEVAHQVSAERLRHFLIRAQAQGRPFHVWHHAGHGQVTDFGFILGLTDPEGMLQRTGTGQIAPVVEACPDLRIVVLNVCQGAAAPGLATTLARLDLPGVIGFRASLYHLSARTFAESFYGHLTSGLPFESAAALARLALVESGAHPLDWAQLLVFARTVAAQPILAPVRQPQRTGPAILRIGGVDVHAATTVQAPTQVGELQVSGQEIEAYTRDLTAFLTSLPGFARGRGNR